MCNIWNGRHAFLWSGSTSLVQKPNDETPCQCGLLTWGEARDMALKALYDAEERRQKEREAEAVYWQEEE